MRYMLRITTGSCEGTYLGGRSSNQTVTVLKEFLIKSVNFYHVNVVYID